MNRLLELFSAGALLTAIALAFALGAAPVFVVRLIARIYPKGDERRDELLAEVVHIKGLVKTFELWRWLGEGFALAICEGIPARRARRGGGLVAQAADPVFIASETAGDVSVTRSPEVRLVELDGRTFAEVAYTFRGEEQLRRVPYAPGDSISFTLPTGAVVSVRSMVTVRPIDTRPA